MDRQQEDSFESLVEAAGRHRRHVDLGWGHIAGLQTVKEAIAFNLGLFVARPPAGVRLMPVRRMLFYGPPGTGKTLLAAATSAAIRDAQGRPAAFYSVKVSEILSEHFGQSARIVSALYARARRDEPSVVFLDEFETIAQKRRGAGAEERRILSTLLAELDGLMDKGAQAPRVLTIAATNSPWELDRAILSRFATAFLVTLPDEPTRRGIVEILVKVKAGMTLGVGESEWAEILRATDRFSGRELEVGVQEAIRRMLHEMNPALARMALVEPAKLAKSTLRVRTIGGEELANVFRAMEPQTSVEEIEDYESWSPDSLAA